MPTRLAGRETGELMLRSLPAQHREIIIATYFRRQTTLEAAQRLGLAPDIAKDRLYQAMQDLYAMLATGWPTNAPHPAPVRRRHRFGTRVERVGTPPG